MKNIIGLTIVCLLAGRGLVSAQHTMPPGMSHEEHLKQLEKEKALKERGAIAMGFDQDASTHHFTLAKNGGAIVVVSKGDDPALVKSLRAHLKEITRAFADGTFDKPLATHAELPPGSAVMQERKDRIAYRYKEQRNGGRVMIETKDAAALEAIHAFLRYQIIEHKTGDPLTIP